MLPTVQSAPGQKQVAPTTLSDGSKIRVGPETKLYIPDGFPKKVRAIRVDGTATVDVAPVTADVRLPFRIVAKRMHFIATGTSFGVSAYPGDSAVLVQVKEGSVTVKAGKTVTVVPAGQAMIAEYGAVRAATPDERVEGLGWVDGQLVVKNKKLKEMAAALTRWFAYDVKVIDQPLFERRASIDVPLDSSRLAISQVETAANVKFAYEGETKVFRDAAKANATKANATKANAKKK